MARMAGAEDRAETLFRSLLTAEQLITLDDENTSCVIERGSGGGLYQIQIDGRLHGNIKAIDEHGCVLGTLCVAPDMYTGNGRMPNMDGYVGQLLAIRFTNWPCSPRPTGRVVGPASTSTSRSSGRHNQPTRRRR